MPETESQDAARLSELSGQGIFACLRALRLANEADFAGDVLLALCYVEADALPVRVPGDRHEWNLAEARCRVDTLRTMEPELDEAFPLPGGPTYP